MIWNQVATGRLPSFKDNLHSRNDIKFSTSTITTTASQNLKSWSLSPAILKPVSSLLPRLQNKETISTLVHLPNVIVSN